MVRKKRILIIEDYPLLRIAIRELLSREADVEIVGESDDGRDARILVEIFAADLVLMDLSLAGASGMEAIADIKRHHPETHVLVLSMHKAIECVRGSLLAGADGYVLKDDAHDELRNAIRWVLNGKKYLSAGISLTNGCQDTGNSSDYRIDCSIHAAQHAIYWR